MKAELITKKEFQPVTIQLTFETQGELDDFDNYFGWQTEAMGAITKKKKYKFSKKMWDNCDKIYNLITQS